MAARWLTSPYVRTQFVHNPFSNKGADKGFVIAVKTTNTEFIDANLASLS